MSSDLRARVRAAISAQAVARGLDGPGRVEAAVVPLDAATDAVMAVLDGADSEPTCSECGGRPKRGLVKSEDGETWQCSGCYEDLARGPIPGGVEP